MCFGNNPGCNCCKQLPIWANSASFGTISSGPTSVNGAVTAATTISPLNGEAYDHDDTVNIFARSYDVVYVLGSGTIKQYSAYTLDELWESSAPSTAPPSASDIRHMSVGDFGLVLMDSFTDDSTPLACWIDKDGNWVMEPRSITEVYLDGGLVTSSLLVVSPNSMHCVRGTVVGSYVLTAIDSTTCKLEITTVYTTGGGGTNSTRVGVDRDGNVWCTLQTGVFNLYAAPGPDICYVEVSGTTVTHGVIPRETTIDAWEDSYNSGSVTGVATKDLLRVRLCGMYVCDLVITPAEAAIIFPSLDVSDAEVVSGNIDFTKYYISPDHTKLIRREAYNFGSIIAQYSDESSFPNPPTGNVLDGTTVGSDTAVTYTVDVDESGTEVVSSTAWELEDADAVFTLNFSSGPLTDFTFADIKVYLMRYNGTIGQGDDPTITFDALEAGDLVANTDTNYTLTVPNVDGGVNGGVMTITMQGTLAAYDTTYGIPVAKKATSNEWYYVPPNP